MNAATYTTYMPAFSWAIVYVPHVMPIATPRTIRPSIKKMMARVLANSGPTLVTLRQWGHLASALFNVLNRKVSWQCAHVTRHIPGTLFGATEPPLAGVVGLGARLMIRLQFGLGQAMRWDVALQISRQLQGQRTYLRPGGALRIGVASLHSGHFTTCWSFLPDMSIIFWHTLHATIGIPPLMDG